MTDMLAYASPTVEDASPLWQRVLVVPLYYLGWTIGCGVAGSLIAAITARGSLNDVPKLVVGGVVGGVTGAVLAYLARARRWPQVTIAVIGGIAAAFASYWMYDMWQGPRSMVWEFFFAVGMTLLGGAVAAAAGGAAGIALTCRRVARSDAAGGVP